MRKYEEVKVAKAIISEVYCNKCGEELLDQDIVLFFGANFTVKHGYGSKRDTDEDRFDLCWPCYEKIIKEFKLKVRPVRGGLI